MINLKINTQGRHKEVYAEIGRRYPHVKWNSGISILNPLYNVIGCSVASFDICNDSLTCSTDVIELDAISAEEFLRGYIKEESSPTLYIPSATFIPLEY